jgi:hypothetical protein
MSDPASHLLLDTVEAAEVLTISPRTLEDYRWRGGGPTFYRLARRLIRYQIEELMAFALKSKRENAGGDEMP